MNYNYAFLLIMVLIDAIISIYLGKLILLPLLISISSIIFYLNLMHSKDVVDLEYKKEFLNFLQNLSIQLKEHGNIFISIRNINPESYKLLNNFIKEIKARLNLNETLDDTLANINQKSISALISDIVENLSINMDLSKTISSINSSIIGEIKRSYDYMYISAQKYQILDTLSSVIIPAFMIFGFIGYSIISTNSSILIFVVPILSFPLLIKSIILLKFTKLNWEVSN